MGTSCLTYQQAETKNCKNNFTIKICLVVKLGSHCAITCDNFEVPIVPMPSATLLNIGPICAS